MVKLLFLALELPAIILVVANGRGPRSHSGIAAVTAAPSSSATFFPSLTRSNGGRRRHHNKSLLLQSSNAMRKTYSRPPHDARLYDILQVKPNATLAEIQRSWRRLSREWHPDKVAVRKRKRRHVTKKHDDDRSNSGAPPPPPRPPPGPLECDNQSNTEINEKMTTSSTEHFANNADIDNSIREDEHVIDVEEEYARQKLEDLTKAYEILSEDHTRLLYHKYGLVGGADAAIQLLTGEGYRPGNDNPLGNLQQSSMGSAAAATSEEQVRLLELMGYPPGGSSNPWPFHQYTDQRHHRTYHSSHKDHEHRQRLAYLTATITERLRPLVEGTVSQDLFVNDIHRECNAIKKSLLGAHILRCIGRAYRIEGYRALRTMHGNNGRMTIRDAAFSNRRRRKYAPHHEVADRVFDGLRGAKHYASAALASGKLVMMEQKIKKLEEDRARQKREQEEEKNRRKQERMNAEKTGVKRIEGSRTDSMSAAEQTATHFATNIGALSGDENDVEFNLENSEYDHFNIGALSDDDEEDFLHSLHDDLDDDNYNHCHDDDDLEEELQHLQHQKAYSALLSAHQMEALWKITKIELDRTIREACRLILEPIATTDGEGGWYAFCPSERSPYREDWHHKNYHHASQPPPHPPSPRSHRRHHHHHQRRTNNRYRPGMRYSNHERPDGWVGTTGEAVSLEVGRLRAAAAMILVGDIMVQCSKEGTGWNK